MVIVDTTVWVDYFRGISNPETDWLDAELDRQRLGLTDLILCEVLQVSLRNPWFPSRRAPQLLLPCGLIRRVDGFRRLD